RASSLWRQVRFWGAAAAARPYRRHNPSRDEQSLGYARVQPNNNARDVQQRRQNDGTEHGGEPPAADAASLALGCAGMSPLFWAHENRCRHPFSEAIRKILICLGLPVRAPPDR